MSVRGEVTARVTVVLGGTLYTMPVTSVTIEMDSESSPYVTGSLVTPIDSPTITPTNIDPTESAIWINLTITRAAPVPQARTYRVMLRSISVDYLAAEVTFDFASGESLLRDHHLMNTNGLRVAGADLTAKVNTLLAQVGLGPVDYPPASSPPDSNIGDEAQWETGMSVWDAVTALTGRHGYFLWCDDAAKWNLSQSRLRTENLTFTTTGPGRSLVTDVMRRSRDDEWWTAVMIHYRQPDGTEAWDVAVATPTGPHKPFRYDFERQSPGGGRAALMLPQFTPRGRAVELMAVSDYSATPGMLGWVTTSRGSVGGVVSSVRWQLPDDEMSVRLRNVVEV